MCSASRISCALLPVLSVVCARAVSRLVLRPGFDALATGVRGCLAPLGADTLVFAYGWSVPVGVSVG